ncbi:MAG: hypothetical protein A3B71_04970 [Gammaproteobacteria bacterium RIFCSPHIGHO2_02_FULL_42_43]|nr:MAG: hypothetical protein A3B71_04970 [Gammaproteobacteria bacterium RIFCSPHIGHO2_02_FULL_42_43]
MKKILNILIIFVAVTTVMWRGAALAQPASQPQSVSSYCPLITDITQDPVKKNWQAPAAYGRWKSYHLSFANQLTQFLGAQWVGENIGQVTCIYQSVQNFTEEGKQKTQQSLSVKLVFDTLTYQPTGGKWRHSKRGVYNCRARTEADLPFDQSSCPFNIRMKKVITNIYKEAEELKK